MVVLLSAGLALGHIAESHAGDAGDFVLVFLLRGFVEMDVLGVLVIGDSPE